MSASLGMLALGGLRLPASTTLRSTRLLGFAPITPSSEDTVRVAEGYDCQVLLAWGDPFDPDGPAWHPNNTAEEQRQQAGMHHDGMHFFADRDSEGRELSTRGTLAINHEYIDIGLLYADGAKGHSLDNVRKAQAAVGVSLVRLQRDADMNWQRMGGWSVDANTDTEIRGPARGHALMRTQGALFTPAERAGTGVRGTFANCSSGFTPWGTYLTCEEHVQDLFKRSDEPLTDNEKLYRIGNGYGAPPGWGNRFGWELHDQRFDTDLPEARNHPHRFGWVVEIDPADPDRTPAKRTALGRFCHENASVVVAPSGQIAAYMGDDSRDEFIYKFVSDRAWKEGDHEHNWSILDTGTLHVAKFHRDVDPDSGVGRGEWIPLTADHPELAPMFDADDDAAAKLAKICIFTRQAARLVGATPMDRPEWIAAPQHQGAGDARVDHVYCSLTNNSKRTAEQVHPANPRAKNVFGHILRWTDTDRDPTRTTFAWEVFLLGGRPDHPDAEHRGTITTEGQHFGSPDGLWFDRRGVLWVQTDVSASTINEKAYQGMGNNQMLAVDPATREVRRFLTGPTNSEITGLAQTPDGRTFFANIQHPGEIPDDTPSDPDAPLSTWPPNEHGRPRSATLVIQRTDRTDPRAIGEP